MSLPLLAHIVCYRCMAHFPTEQNNAKGTWCSGITSASHADGPGFKSQCVHSLLHRIPPPPTPHPPPNKTWLALGRHPRVGAENESKQVSQVRDSIVVSTSACDADDPSSFLGRGVSSKPWLLTAMSNPNLSHVWLSWAMASQAHDI